MVHQRLKEVVQVLEDISERTRGRGKIRERELVASERSVQEAGLMRLVTLLALEKIISVHWRGGEGESLGGGGG